MCRWIAYIGKPVMMDTLVSKPAHSLLQQSLHARMLYKPDGSMDTTNGDGFGVGWYMDKAEPGLFKVADPAWSNENINEICSQVKSRLFMAHIRAASAGAIQRSNAHPFKYKNWLFQHNGRIENFHVVRRDLQFDIAPDLYSLIKGTTDSETLFLLALTFGLENEPKKAIERTIERVVRACKENSIAVDFNFSCAFSDGNALYTTRYSSTDRAHSQYYSTYADCLKSINAESDDVPSSSVVVVSEPLDLSLEHWVEMPIGSFAVFQERALLPGTKIAIESLNV